MLWYMTSKVSKAAGIKTFSIMVQTFTTKESDHLFIKHYFQIKDNLLFTILISELQSKKVCKYFEGLDFDRIS